MSQSPLSRLAGPFALIAGAIFVGAQLLLLATFDQASKQATVANPVFVLTQVAYFVGFGILLLALIASYGWEADAAGLFGVVGFCAAVVGTVFLAGDLWFDAFAGPWIITAAPAAADAPSGSVVIGATASYTLFALGWVLFGLASLRARVFPVLISIAIVAGGVAGYLALMPPFGIPLGLAVAALGIWMIRSTAPRFVAASATA